MELKEFIKETISSVCFAIAESQQELKNNGVIVNPDKTARSKTGEQLLHSKGDRFIQNIEFDILVGIEDSVKGDGKAGINVGSLLNVGGGVSTESSNQNQNRIKFNIPIAFPTAETPKEYTKKEGNVVCD